MYERCGEFTKAVVNRRQTEHRTWFLDSEWICRFANLDAEPQHRYEHLRVTLDYPEDYDLMREVARRCHAAQDDFYVPIDQIIKVLVEMNPEWLQRDELSAKRREGIDTRLVYDWVKQL